MCWLSAELMQKVFAVNTSAGDKKQEPRMTSSALNFTQASNTILCYRAVWCLLHAGAMQIFLKYAKIVFMNIYDGFHEYSQMSELCFPKFLLSYYV